MQVGQNPAVDIRPFTDGNASALRIKAVEPGVVAEKGVAVPQLQNEAISNFVRGAVAEIDVVGWIVAAKHPAHYINPHFFRRFFERYGVALGLVHLLALFIPHDRMP